MKINSYDFDNLDKEKNVIAVNDKNNDIVDLSKYDKVDKNNKKKNHFFWPQDSDK